MVKKAVLYTTIFTALLAGLHAWVIQTSGVEWKFIYTHLLLWVLAVGLYLFLGFILKSDISKAGFAFVAGTSIQMFSFIIFMLPTLLSAEDNEVSVALHFMIPFLIYLGIEAFWAMRIFGEEKK